MKTRKNFIESIKTSFQKQNNHLKTPTLFPVRESNIFAMEDTDDEMLEILVKKNEEGGVLTSSGEESFELSGIMKPKQIDQDLSGEFLMEKNQKDFQNGSSDDQRALLNQNINQSTSNNQISQWKIYQDQFTLKMMKMMNAAYLKDQKSEGEETLKIFKKWKKFKISKKYFKFVQNLSKEKRNKIRVIQRFFKNLKKIKKN